MTIVVAKAVGREHGMLKSPNATEDNVSAINIDINITLVTSAYYIYLLSSYNFLFQFQSTFYEAKVIAKIFLRYF